MSLNQPSFQFSYKKLIVTTYTEDQQSDYAAVVTKADLYCGEPKELVASIDFDDSQVTELFSDVGGY